jgi:polyhydroxyalkanoate synthesis repressor PhaR
MNVIKRYPNRKLYNMSSKKYVTLEGVAQLIREGEEVQILDHASGEELTAVTLTQIIFEQEKKQSGFLPRSVLTGLVQSGGHTLSTLRRTLALPLNLKVHVDLEIERRIESLVEMGELSRDEGRQWLEKMLSLSPQTHESSLPSDQDLEQILVNKGIPTRSDLDQLNQRLDELFTKLDEVDLNSMPKETQ